MGSGGNLGNWELGNLYDIFHQTLICHVDALLDLGLRAHIERVHIYIYIYIEREREMYIRLQPKPWLRI